MNKQEFPAGKLVINFRAGSYSLIIVIQPVNFCCLNIRFFGRGEMGIQFVAHVEYENVVYSIHYGYYFNENPLIK